MDKYELCPSLDINNNPNNPIIGIRSFGNTPKRVSKYGIELIRIQEVGIIATGKNFLRTWRCRNG